MVYKQFEACETTIFPLVKTYSAFLMFYIEIYIQNFMQTYQMIACRKQKRFETQLCNCLLFRDELAKHNVWWPLFVAVLCNEVFFVE